MDNRFIAFDKDKFDVKIGGMGYVQFIFQTKDDAYNFTKALTIGHSRYYINAGTNGVENKNDKFIVRMNKELYSSFCPGNTIPEAIIRWGKGNPPLAQIVFAFEDQAKAFSLQLQDMTITPIVPSGGLQQTHVSNGVCFQNGEYIIRIDSPSKMKLDASLKYFQSLKPYVILECIEEECGKLLTDFNINVLAPYQATSTKSIEAATDIYKDECMSNRAKIEKIVNAVEERGNNPLLSFLRGSEGGNFHSTFNIYNLKAKAIQAIEQAEKKALGPTQQQIKEAIEELKAAAEQQQLALQQQLVLQQLQAEAFAAQQAFLASQQNAQMLQTQMLQTQMATTQPFVLPSVYPPQHGTYVQTNAPVQPFVQTATIHQPGYGIPVPQNYGRSPFLINAQPQQHHQQQIQHNIDPTRTNNFNH